jgi:hypothetical protein
MSWIFISFDDEMHTFIFADILVIIVLRLTFKKQIFCTI